MTPFKLDTRLSKDSLFIKKFDLCELRLSKDKRWPWLILVPMRHGVSELFELSDDDQILLNSEISFVAKRLKQSTQCTKINIASLGNIVHQYHVHIVARNECDTNWPGPIWGYGKPLLYIESEHIAEVNRCKDMLSDNK